MNVVIEVEDGMVRVVTKDKGVHVMVIDHDDADESGRPRKEAYLPDEIVKEEE